jgi:opacity protein-like surface antigen
MKQFFLMLSFLCLGFTSIQAQFAAGAGLTYQTKFKKAGIALRGEYGINEKIEAAATLNFIFSEKVEGAKTSVWEINLDGHYLKAMESGLIIYPLAGLNFTSVSAKVDTQIIGSFKASTSRIGLNLGGGLKYPLTEMLNLLVEAKGILAGDGSSRVAFLGGVAYHF